tara:strand:+ start:332 stop:2077 length:1746 start_codon:yes stop_codon:yes gene_type:complete
MKLFKIYYIIIIFILLIKDSYAYVIQKNISNKYFDIFSNPILLKNDIERYRKIINYQEVCKWKLANKYIINLNNEILMGHILAQRYLHPRCYRSEFLELSNWLKKYNDLPQAKRIYRLAIKRMPKGYKRPVSPSKVIGVKESNLEKKVKKVYKSKISLTKNQREEKRKLLFNIKSRVNKGWPTGAVKLLNQRDVKILLDQVEIDQQKELIAKGYFLANKNKLAIKYSKEAIINSSIYVPYANWTAGLAAWRLKDYKLAAKFFSDFSISLQEDEWHQSSGSFWAARSYAKLNKFNEINYWLRRASKNPNSFYGMLSSSILGIKKPIDWSANSLDINIQQEIETLPAGNRIKALIQVGLINELEKEIIKINSLMNKEVAIWSLELAQFFNLAYTQLKIAGNLLAHDVELPIKYFYPIPSWQPRGGYKIDNALMYAFMHQESMFNTKAKSKRGAMGLMQVMPKTAKFITKNIEVKRNDSNILKNPEINLEVAQEYIEYLLQHEKVNKNLIYLTAAYNGGPGNLSKWIEKTNYQNDPLFFMESIPSRETRWFIEKVLTKYWIYENKIGQQSTSLKLMAKGEAPIY